MPTQYSDQFYYMDPANPPARGTRLIAQDRSFTDGNDNYEVDASGADTFNGDRIYAVYKGDVITVRYDDGSVHRITGVTFYVINSSNQRYQVFTPTDDTVLEDSTLIRADSWVPDSTQVDLPELGPPCFTPGVMIDTESGPRPVEDIRLGDLVWTLDNGLQPVRWIGNTTVRGHGAFAPVLVRAGALGNSADMLVSQQHRFMLSDWRAELLIGEPEVLVAAKHLVNGRDVTLSPQPHVTYIHLMFDRHEIVFAENAPTESFFAGGVLADGMEEVQRELAALFPEVAQMASACVLARPNVKRYEATALMA